MRYIIASIIVSILALIAGLSIYVYYGGTPRGASQGIVYYTGSTFQVPKGCARLALLGCTPHPTAYLSQKPLPKRLSELTLEDILDMSYLEDSFSQVLKICKDEKVDHLLIAYLPIYFVKMKQLLKDAFIKEAQGFLKAVAPQIASVISNLKHKLGITLPVTLVLPTQEALERIPTSFVSSEERVQYSIKQFPQIEGRDKLKEIIIINNKGSSQNEGIIRYLRYEYLYDPPVSYLVRDTQKERFHRYIT